MYCRAFQGASVSETSPYLVLGTAGHIDHGKTALIKALTGIDCDTLREEKDRGITIDIGFAHYTLPSGIRLGIVDVPGHRRFIRNMVAGAQGIDLVLLVVSADDAVMPQTTEHLHIVRLLGVRAGLVALNKIDLVDEEIKEIAIADVEDLIKGTFLEGCPIVPVSAVTGEGLNDLVLALDKVAQTVPPRNLGDRFRMPIDRVFTIKGAGTVVTGTTIAGVLKEGDEVDILPIEKRARVRSLQIHGQDAKSANPGLRAAINLVGIDKDEITRGYVLAEPNSIEPTYMFDARIELLPGDYSPLLTGSSVHLHIGTAEVTARAIPLDSKSVSPGDEAVIQLRFGEKLAVSAGDRFILRNATQEFTIGGGEVLDPHPLKHQKHKDTAAERLSELMGADLETAIRYEVAKTPYGISYTSLIKLLNVSNKTLDAALAKLLSRDGDVRSYGESDRRFFTLDVNRERIASAVASALSAHHKAHPLSNKGISLKGIVKFIESTIKAEVPAGAVQECVTDGVKDGRFVETDSTYTLPGGRMELNKDDELAAEIVLEFIGNSSSPRQLDEFRGTWPVERKRMRAIIDHLLETGKLVMAPGNIMFTGKAVEWIRNKLVDHLRREKEVTVSRFREVVDTTRKYAIPLLNLFEEDGIIIRDGDVRRLKT